MAVGQVGDPSIRFFAAYLLSFEYLKTVAEVLAGALTQQGKYFAYCNNIDLGSKYRVTIGGVLFYVLPIDEATVYNEMLELLYIDKNDIKKLDTGGKLDVITGKAMAFTADYPEITYEEGLKLMGPVRDVTANRPV
jgi:hypothetical protein